ncbi:MAG: DUF433 domain-containing protein [Pseudomonadota bacterium]
MIGPTDLTIKETANLAGVKRGFIEKTIEAKIVRPASGKPRLSSGANKYLPLRAVAFFHALSEASLTDLPVRHKKSIWQKMKQLDPMTLAPVEFSPGAFLDVLALSKTRLDRAARYAAAREKYIEVNADILGGTPIIRGTRISVYAVLARLEGAETLDDLCKDYRGIPEDAFEAASIFAKAHPMRGRPSGQAWRNKPTSPST